MNVKVVIGANYGDEGKGLVSGCLAREAQKTGSKTLTVFYNGTIQRAHTFRGKVHHCMAAGEEFGSDTFYYKDFVVDPIALMITNSKPIIDPRCRVILPCDVLSNRKKESERGFSRHGSCGLGLFEAVKRSLTNNVQVLEFPWAMNLYQRIQPLHNNLNDSLYNLDNFMAAVAYVVRNCRIEIFEKTVQEYDTVIFEGGQGLLLDQRNKSDFPHLTPSCPGSWKIRSDVSKLGTPDLYYVSRSYMTRHGAGPMESECRKEDINPEIVDETNQPNEWQGSLRFGRLNMETLWDRVQSDVSSYEETNSVNMVFTHLNYTDGFLDTNIGRKEIVLPDYFTGIYRSDQKDYMERTSANI